MSAGNKYTGAPACVCVLTFCIYDRIFRNLIIHTRFLALHHKLNLPFTNHVNRHPSPSVCTLILYIFIGINTNIQTCTPSIFSPPTWFRFLFPSLFLFPYIIFYLFLSPSMLSLLSFSLLQCISFYLTFLPTPPFSLSLLFLLS